MPSASDGTPTLGLQVSTLLRPSNSNQTHSTSLPGCPAHRRQIWECLMVTRANSCNKPPQVCVYTLKVLFLSRNSDRLTLGGSEDTPQEGAWPGPQDISWGSFFTRQPGGGLWGQGRDPEGSGGRLPCGETELDELAEATGQDRPRRLDGLQQTWTGHGHSSERGGQLGGGWPSRPCFTCRPQPTLAFGLRFPPPGLEGWASLGAARE